MSFRPATFERAQWIQRQLVSERIGISHAYLFRSLVSNFFLKSATETTLYLNTISFKINL